MLKRRSVAWLTVLVVLAGVVPAAAETMCDPSYQDCRAPLLNLINNETVGIDVAFWFMTDARYEQAIVAKWQAGVPVRILVDPRANSNPDYANNATMLNDFAAAGIPMRYRTAAGILHWKMMLFAGQNQVEFSGANYAPSEFVYTAPYSNYDDENTYTSDDPAVVQTFMTEYDNLWTDTTNYANYANVNNPLTRIYPTYPMDPDLNFPQQQDYALRILKRYAAETQKIDVAMYRITDVRHTNAMITAFQKGIPVRIYSDTFEYRNTSRLWVAYNLDKLFAAGIPIRVRAHDGLNHEKLVLLYSQGMSVFGSSNWSTPSANEQQEHNYFTTKAWIFQYFQQQFERKWNNTAPNGAIESQPFVPLPPDTPNYLSPANGAVGADRAMELHWDGGPWGQVYDIYFGTDPNPPLLSGNQQLGPTDPNATPVVTQKWILPLLQPGTTYYWKIVSKTMAGLTKSGPVWSFTTTGNPPSAPPPSPGANTIVLWTATDVPSANLVGNWQFVSDATAAGGAALWNPDHGMSTISPPLAQAVNYFTTTFTAQAGIPYHVWLRLRAQSNSSANNSVTFQFDNSTDQFGSRLYQIGTTEGGETTLVDPSGTLNNWGWADNSQPGVPATFVYFPTTGTHTIEIQQREDGAFVDQIVISPDAFLTSPPGGTLNDTTIYGSTADGAAPPPAPSAVPPPPPPVPLPWQQQDVGATGLPGFANFDNSSQVFSMEAAGADVWGSADAFHYIYQPLNGDGSIVARVASVQNTASWTKAGVMIRQDLTPGAMNAFMLVSAAKGLSFQTRAAAASATTNVAGPAKAAPYWVRIDRAGTTFTAYQSADGAAWTTVGTATLPMTSSVYVGLALSSHNADASATAAFDHVTVNGTATCGFTLSPTNQTLNAAGDTGTISVMTGAACSWTATSGAPWLTITSGASGTGNGTVAISAAANSAGSRAANVTIGGSTFIATQSAAACSFTLSPSASQIMNAAGDMSSFAVTTGSWCSWSATSSAPSWLTVTSGNYGTGNGTVTVVAAANSGGARSATVAAGGQTFTASQAASSCTYSIGSASGSFSASGGSLSVAVTTNSWCSWTATPSDPSWLTVTSGAPGTGNGTVKLTAAANSGAARSETVSIAGQTYTASQAAAGCTFTISPASSSLNAAGDTATVNVTTASWCSWNATSNAPSWLTVTGGASGTGNGTVTIAAAANPAGARSGTVSIGTQTWTGAQATAPCSFSISPTSQSMAYGGDTANITMTTSSWCSWTATSSSSWLTITSPTAGTGSATITASAAANTAGARTATITVGGQTFTATQAAPPPPSNWSSQDIGAVGVAGATTSDSTGTILSVTGAGADVWGTADALQYAYQSLTGDGSIVAHVGSVQNVNAWTKAGLMIRATLDAGAPNAFMLVSPSKGASFQRRLSAGGSTVATLTGGVPPVWLRLDRAGNTFTAYASTDGSTWSFVDTDTIPMPSTVFVGLGVSSHTTTATATASFDTVTVTPGTPTSPTPLPTGWSHQDVGTVGVAGAAAYNAASSGFDVKGAGADIWNSADAFHFAYKAMTGDGTVVARVTSVQNTNAWTKAGVMIRETLSANATEASMLVTPSKGLTFETRATTGSTTTSVAGALVTAPYWVMLQRSGTTFSAYSSPDGATWTLIGTSTINMASTVYVGLAVSSHTTTAAALATFDNVSTP